MPITKQAKKTLVEDLTKRVAEAKEGVLVGYQGLTVIELQELRSDLREIGVTMHIVKNTLLKKILEGAKIDGLDPLATKKPLGLVLGEDEVMPVKVLAEFAKKHDKLELIAGAVDGVAVDEAQLKALAALPNREEMLGIVVGTIAAPISSFARVMAGVPRSFMFALKAIGESKS